MVQLNSNLTLAHTYVILKARKFHARQPQVHGWYTHVSHNYITNPCEESVAQQVHYTCKTLLASKHITYVRISSCVSMMSKYVHIIYTHAIYPRLK